MSDLDLSVLVSRSQLGLDDLEINDFLNYYVGSQFLGGAIAWNRTQATSPFEDGATTTNRTRQMVTEPVTVEIMGGNLSELLDNKADLVDAFNQDSFTVAVHVRNTLVAKYRCEASDITPIWQGPRLIALQEQMQFAVQRQPVPISGAA